MRGYPPEKETRRISMAEKMAEEMAEKYAQEAAEKAVKENIISLVIKR